MTHPLEHEATIEHHARGARFEIMVFRERSTGARDLFIFKQGRSEAFPARNAGPKDPWRFQPLEKMIADARSDIDSDQSGLY